nr:ribonuclease R [Pseudobdellovibrionaceae bacterium]
KIVTVLGDASLPLHDIKKVLISHHIPEAFAGATLAEAKLFTSEPEEKDFKNRKDLRNKKLITIDGATAKDFDDAVLTELNSKGFLLHVAIADVSHYVKPKTSINEDAYKRGTSVYFPNYVVPMLPEALSNGLCSLNPNVNRLCMVAEIQFDFTGEVTSRKFYEAVMKSQARMTYGEAQEMVDGVEIEKFEHVRENVLRCADLAKILMAKRMKEGSLDLEIPETELEIDEAGVPVDIIKSERLFAHRLIEELMLAANVAVATFLSDQKITSVYRIHEQPSEQSLRILEKYLWNFGGKTKLSEGKLQKRLTKALEEFVGRPEAQILHILTLRSMNQAKYSTQNVGHFGLGFSNYTHFTSPIRRYPDLIVHRLLKNQIMPNSSYRWIEQEDLTTSCTVLSAAEQRSAKAERQFQSIKKARFMLKYLNQEFDGMISSVTKFGVFVLLRDFDLDGLVRLDDLGRDRFTFDEENLVLRGSRSGKVFTIGQLVRIQVISADTELGQINFSLLTATENKNLPEESTTQQKSRRHQKQDSRNKPPREQKPHKEDKERKDYKTYKDHKKRKSQDFSKSKDSKGPKHNQPKQNPQFKKNPQKEAPVEQKLDPRKSFSARPTKSVRTSGARGLRDILSKFLPKSEESSAIIKKEEPSSKKSEKQKPKGPKRWR